jgi:hypothetical protein
LTQVRWIVRQPSDRFENILDECIAAIQEQGQTPENCLSRYPAQRAELAPLLQVVVRLQAARSLRASPEFRRASMTRMSNLVAARPRRARPLRTLPNLLPSLRQRWAAVAMSVILVCLLMGGGAVSASNNTLPGDTLYPVKQAVEVVQLAISLNEASNVRLHLDFATRRLDETKALLKKGRPQEMERALADYTTQMDSVSTLMNEEKGLAPDRRAVLADLVIAAQARQEAQLAALQEQAPETVQPAIQQALTVSRTARDRAREPKPTTPAETPEPSRTPTPAPSPIPTGKPEPPATPTVLPSPEPTERSTPSPEPAMPIVPTPPWPTPRWPNMTATLRVIPPAWPTPHVTSPVWPTMPPQPTPRGSPTVQVPRVTPPAWPTVFAPRITPPARPTHSRP